MNQIGTLNKLKGIEGIGISKPATQSSPLSNKDVNPFKDALKQASVTKGESLPEKISEQKEKQRVLEFSNHAVERMRSRGIHFAPDMLDKIELAHQQAKEKGAKETLVLTDKAALIVNVKNDKIVTVMDRNALKNNVFTKIDSTVVV